MNRLQPLTVGIAGGSGSGKSWLASFLAQELGPRATLISQDWYYQDRSSLPPHERAECNFDHPSSMETGLLVKHLDSLRAGQPVEAPRYCFATHVRTSPVVVQPAPVILLEGLFVLHEEEVRQRLDHAIFVEVPPEVRLARRRLRDAAERAIPATTTEQLFTSIVAPMHQAYVQPSANHATEVWHALEDATFPHVFVAEMKRRLL